MSEKSLEKANTEFAEAFGSLLEAQDTMIKEWVLNLLTRGDFDKDDTSIERVGPTFQKPKSWKDERIYRITVSTTGEGYLNDMYFGENMFTRLVKYDALGFRVLVNSRTATVEIMIGPSTLWTYPATRMVLEEMIRQRLDGSALALRDLGNANSLEHHVKFCEHQIAEMKER